MLCFFFSRLWNNHCDGTGSRNKCKAGGRDLEGDHEDFEQTRFRHGRGWPKSKNSGPNFMGRTVPKLLDLSKQRKTNLWELSIVGVCHKTPLLQANQTNILHFYLFAFSRD